MHVHIHIGLIIDSKSLFTFIMCEYMDWRLIVKAFSISSCVNICPVFSLLFMMLVNMLSLPLLRDLYNLLTPLKSILIMPLIKVFMGPIPPFVWVLVFKIHHFFKNVWILSLIEHNFIWLYYCYYYWSNRVLPFRSLT